MAHVHDHYSGGSTTVVESDREGPATALVVLIGLVLLGALIWFFAFSGVVFNRSSDNSPDINIQNPPAQNDTNTNTNTVPDSGTQPNPNPS
jgi:cytoskeletal protein RodZ